MKAKAVFQWGGAVALCVLLAGVVLYPRAANEEPKAESLFPKLGQEAPRVSRLVMQPAGDAEPVVLEKRGSGWVVASEHGYPANTDKVRGVLGDLAAAEIVEERKGEHASLGVDDISSPGAGSVLVQVYLGNAREPEYEVLAGRTSGNRRARYVRLPEASAVWMVNRDFAVDVRGSSWLEPQIMRLPVDRIEWLQRIGADDAPLVIKRIPPDSPNFVPDHMPDGMRLRYPGALDGMVRAVGNARLISVFPVASGPKPDAGLIVLEYHFRDGLVVDIKTFRTTEGAYLTVRARTDRKILTRQDRDIQQQVTDEVKALNDRHAPWVYQISAGDHAVYSKPLRDHLTADTPAPVDNKPADVQTNDLRVINRQ